MAVERRAMRTQKEGPQAKKRKATVAIVGAGRLGTALGRALAAQGYLIEAVVALRKTHARKAADLISPRPIVLSTTQLEQLPSSDILLITTPDDAIERVALQLATRMKSHRTSTRHVDPKVTLKRTALHASGALSSDVLHSLQAAGFATGSMHPLVSVSNSVHGAESLRSAFFCLEGDRIAQRVARSLVSDLGASSFSIKTKDKALYHAAAVMASGHMTALFDIATQILTECGLSARRARAVFLPLLKSTLENLYTSDPARALTGTFARADAATVRRHLAVLRSARMRDARAAYTLLGFRSLELAKKAGARSDLLKVIVTLLKEADGSGQRGKR